MCKQCCSWVKKRKAGCSEEDIGGKRGIRTIFPYELELQLIRYVKNRAKMCYGMTATQIRKAAFTLALKNNLSVPASWIKNQCAGME